MEARFVSLLGSGKAAAIDAVVDILVDDSVDRVDRRAERLRVEIECRIAKLIELRIQHADDL